MKIRQLKFVPFRGIMPFAILFVLLAITWVSSLQTFNAEYDEQGNVVTDLVMKERERAAELNTCEILRTNPIEAKCTGLYPEENEALSKELQNASTWESIEEFNELRTAEELSETYILRRAFYIELGGNKDGTIKFMAAIASVVFTAICFLVAIIVLAVSLPRFLATDSEEVAKRAGGLVKTSLGFIIASGTTLIAGFVLSGIQL